MAERQTVAAATLREIIEAEFSKSLGRSAADYMPRVQLRSREGQPNWDGNIGTIALPILSAFNEALERVKTAYDLDEQSHRPLRSL